MSFLRGGSFELFSLESISMHKAIVGDNITTDASGKLQTYSGVTLLPGGFIRIGSKEIKNETNKEMRVDPKVLQEMQAPSTSDMKQ